jgi:hypothetical protein
MIPYQELESALQRWKIRQEGGVEAPPVDGYGESVRVESAYVEAEAEVAFPSQNGGTNEIVLEGELDEN